MARKLGTPPPAVTVDTIILTVGAGLTDLRVLLVRRGRAPFAGRWAIPGGFVEPGESLEQAARRELAEETAVTDLAYLEQLYTFGDPGRDPRGRVITVAYYALVPAAGIEPHAGDDAADARWFSMFDLPRLAFDHGRILDYALARLRAKMEYTTVGFGLLGEEFTLSELQSLYELILRRRLDKRNFRRRILAMGRLEPTGRSRMNGVHRPAGLYRFAREKGSTPKAARKRHEATRRK
ncbi:MAG: NADH pyrophosphatase [Phycisphaerae bacterium]|nr:NADH pyrophosphatase [Phycisphaerae bacterium]